MRQVFSGEGGVGIQPTGGRQSQNRKGNNVVSTNGEVGTELVTKT